MGKNTLASSERGRMGTGEDGAPRKMGEPLRSVSSLPFVSSLPYATLHDDKDEEGRSGDAKMDKKKATKKLQHGN